MPKQLEIPFEEYADKRLPIPFEEYEEGIGKTLEQYQGEENGEGIDNEHAEALRDCGK